MIVVDASAVVAALTVGGDVGDRARDRLRSEALAAPELMDLEVVAVLRRMSRAGQLSQGLAALALTDLARMPVRRLAHRPLISRCWDLRENLTSYDAAYVATAEALDATLLTSDARLSNAPGVRCTVEVLSAA